MDKLKNQAARSQKSRDKAKESGMKEVRFKISEKEYETVERLRFQRAGCGEPYTVADYMVALFRVVLPIDEQQYQSKADALGQCANCQQKLPEGCGGAFKGAKDCYHTLDYKGLEISSPIRTQHNSLEGALINQQEFETVEKMINRLHKFYDHTRDASQQSKKENDK